MIIYEPCNYASNIAYYHATTKICDYGENWSIPVDKQKTLKRLFATLTSGSAFFHGSMTHVGADYDTQAIALIASFSHHAQVLDLTTSSTSTSILHQLSKNPRN